MATERTLREARRRAWMWAAILFAGSLVLPALGWLLFPTHRVPFVPRSPATAPEAPRDKVPSPVTPASVAVIEAPEPTAVPDRDDDVPVSGKVVDPDGNPVPAAFVACEDRTPELSTTADGEGHFKLPADAAGCAAVSQVRGFGPS